jgi:hypothetical protein
MAVAVGAAAVGWVAAWVAGEVAVAVEAGWVVAGAAWVKWAAWAAVLLVTSLAAKRRGALAVSSAARCHR